ncbi:hypothetical protein HD806DRAFT_550329 [Xylariaceae sp. AK1471]|nr:hypothetical protein HD806DRAFT_550329 [Xylariaceae sp. AK1471]
MQFKSTVLVLLGATRLMAQPVQEGNIMAVRDYVELDRKPASTGNGTLIFMGPEDGANVERSANLMEGRASCQTDPAPTCSGSHAARNEICDQLITELFADPTVSVGSSPRQICYQGAAADKNSYCCVSWHKVVDNLTKGDLAPIAQKIQQTCTQNGISGKTYSVWVHSTCTDVCVSNRGTGC